MDDFLSLDIIEEIIVERYSNNDAKFLSTYEANRLALLSYKFWRDENLLPEFDDLPIKPVRVGSAKYAYYEKNSRIISNALLIKGSRRVEQNFFQDLDKPLLVENELNITHWEYLYDNVRRSEDYGDDNHIYLSYDNVNEFLLFLCVENITIYLDTEKFIFLFGKEKEYKYPMDLLREFNIDYTDVKLSEIRVEEINRLFVNIGSVACSGNTFFMGILDCHNDIISTAGFSMADYVFVYKNALSNKTVHEVEENYNNKTMEQFSLKSFMQLFNNRHFWVDTEYPCPSSKLFFDNLNHLFPEDYKPDDIEWIKGIFLAYAMSMGRKFTSRISPALKLETHYYIHFPEEGNRWTYNKALFKRFKYCKVMIPIRYFIQARSSAIDKYVKTKHSLNYLEDLAYYLISDYRLYSLFYQKKIIYKFLYTHEIKDDYDIIMMRLEDFKHYPKTSLLSLCEYLDIPWNDILMKITINGKEYMASGTKAFDSSPLKKRYYNVCNPFDYYRIELIMSKYWKHFGYEPLIYKGDDIYTEEEVLKMFELPFQCEQYIMDEKEKARIPAIRKQIYELVKKRLHEGDAPLDENGEKMPPIPCLKPKMECVDGELYN